MTEQTPQDAYINKQQEYIAYYQDQTNVMLTRINQLEAFMHEIIDEARERSFSAEEKVRVMKKLARRALGEEK